MLAIGLRSSCAVSEISPRWRSWAAPSLLSMSFRVRARLRTSSRASGTGRARGWPVRVTSWAPRRSSVIGRRVDPAISQLAPASRTSSSGVPMSSARVSVARLSPTWP